MATKIRRSLYIGLGGTGMKALLHTKKMFIDTYGEVPPMIGFLGIDTDGGEYNKSLKAVNGEDVKLLANEQLPICVNDARPIYDRNKAHFSWIPDKNVYALTSMNLGAGQVRTNGRFALTVNRDDVVRAIVTKLNDIQNARIINNPNYELLSTAAPEIHMVFSICGGTGAGTFINMAYLLRDVAPQSKLCGYAVLPEVFKAMSNTGMAKVAPNAYGALVDLDYLMHRSMNDTPLTIEYLQENKHSVVRGRPFNSVVFIDNKNENNDTYTDVNQLTEMISLALITSSGSLSIAGAAVGDNLEKNISEGSMNVENKVAWAGGMGACEIVYRGEALSNIYRMKAAQRVINSLLSTDTDADAIANAWIDSAEVKIRENNGRDDVTNFIADKSPKYGFSVSDKKNPRPDVDQNIESNKIKTDEIDKKVDALLTRVRGELRNLIVKNINGEGGVALAKNILAVLEAQVELCQGEMNAEKDELNGKLPTFSSKIDILINDIKDTKGLFSGGKVKEYCEELEQEVKNYNTVLRDIQRHDAAITIYNSILVLIKESAEKVECIEKLLDGVKASLTKKIAALQAGAANDNGIFQINLAAEDAKRIVVDTKEIVVSDFVNTLGGEFKIYGLGEYSVSEVENFFMEYTKVLNGANAYANKGVEETLREILNNGEEGEKEFKRIISLAISKSMPLFCYDYDGYFPAENPSDIFYVGVYDAANSILAEDDNFKNEVPGNNNVSFASIGMKDKIIVYRQEGVVPVYAINGIKRFQGEFSQCNACICHFDANILRKMQHEGFGINPVVQNNNDMLDLWVKGFIYGLIKNENKCYYMKSESLGDYLDDYWVKLAEWRDEAFEEFKRNELVVVKDFNAYINSENEKKGAETIGHLMADAKANYYDNYSQIKISKQTLKSKGYEKVAELMKAEGLHLRNL